MSAKTRERFEAALARTALSQPTLERLHRGLRPIVGVQPQDGPVPVGGSKLGGRPHLPPGIEWPTVQRPSVADALAMFGISLPPEAMEEVDEDSDEEDEDDDEPEVPTYLPFLCQINFAEAKAFDEDDRLPDAGILYVFANSSNAKGTARLIYTRELLEHQPEMPFPAVDEESEAGRRFLAEGRFEERPLRCSSAFMVDDAELLHHGELPVDVQSALRDAHASLGLQLDPSMRLLGPPRFFRRELEASELHGSEEAALVLSGRHLDRLDDRGGGSVFVESTIHVIVAREHLRRGVFDEAKVIVESGT